LTKLTQERILPAHRKALLDEIGFLWRMDKANRDKQGGCAQFGVLSFASKLMGSQKLLILGMMQEHWYSSVRYCSG
jgi:hypothetical protein